MNTWSVTGTGPARPLGATPGQRLLFALALPLTLAVGMGWLVVATEVNALFLAVSLLVSIFILFDFRIGVVCLILVMPLSSSILLPRGIAGMAGLNPLNLLILATFVSYLLRGMHKGDLGRLLPPPLLWYYLLPLVVGGLLGTGHVREIPSFFFTDGSIAFQDGAGYIRDMVIKPSLFMVVLGLLVGAATARSARPEHLIYAMLASVWAMGLVTIALVLVAGVSLGELASSHSRAFFEPLGIHANALGRLYAIAYALMLFTFVETDDRRLKIALAATMGMVVLALMLTFSRAAFLCFAIVNLLFIFSRRKMSYLLAGGLAFACLALILPDAVYDRLGTGWGEGANAVSAGRVNEIWLPLLPEIWNSPIYGQGLGSLMWSQAMKNGLILDVTHPHSAYLALLLDVGILGLLLVGAYYLHLWRGFKRLSQDLQLSPTLRGFFAGAAVGLLSYAIAGFSGSSFFPCLEQIFLWLAIGMMYGLGQRPAGEAP